MEFTAIIAALLAAAGVVFCVRGTRRARARRTRLARLGRIVSWRRVRDNPGEVLSIVLANFGYGAEEWVHVDEQSQINLEDECFEQGFLIFPRPPKSDLRSLCQHRRIKLIRRKGLRKP